MLERPGRPPARGRGGPGAGVPLVPVLAALVALALGLAPRRSSGAGGRGRRPDRDSGAGVAPPEPPRPVGAPARARPDGRPAVPASCAGGPRGRPARRAARTSPTSTGSAARVSRAARTGRRRVPSGARPGPHHGALGGWLGGVASRWAARPRPIIRRREPSTSTTPDLLRQLDAAHRPRVHDDRGRHPRAPSPAARRGDVLPHRRRRARVEGRTGSAQEQGLDPYEYARPDRRAPGESCPGA